MLLITYFENLFSKVFSHDFSKHPKRISLDEKVVTFEMLQRIKSIEEIKEHLIDDEVTKMMYKAYVGWVDYIKNVMKLKLKYVNEHNDKIKEIFARRNLYVHNDGIVNSIYLKSVNTKNGAKKGKPIGINRKYIDNAINIIECAGVSLVIELWLKEAAKDETELGKITDLLFDECLMQERWGYGIILYELCLEYKMPEAYRLICEMNKWLCYKNIGKIKDVQDEINNIDLSAALPRYMLGKLALQEKYDEFFQYFDSQDDVSEDTLHEWPIFNGVRETRCYIDRYGKDDKLEDDKLIIQNEKSYDIDEINIIDVEEIKE